MGSEVIEKFKESWKSFLFWVLIPFGGVLAVAYYIVSYFIGVKNQSNLLKSQEKLKDVLLEKEAAKANADRSELTYDELRDKYNKYKNGES